MRVLLALLVVAVPFALACGDADGSGGAGTTTAASGTTPAGPGATTGSTKATGSGASTQATSVTGSATSSTGGPDPEGVFVAVGYGGRRVRSVDDGLTWVDDQDLIPNGGDDFYLLRAVGFGGGSFVAAGWRSVTSPDGAAWTDEGETGVNWIGSILHDGQKWVAVGGYGLRGTSADGVTWEDHAIDTVASHGSMSLAHGDVMGGRFVSTNDDGARAWATDGTDWQTSSGEGGTQTRFVAYGNGAFVAIGGDRALVSTDGGASFANATTFSTDIGCVTFGGGKFVAVGDGTVYTSTDGATWEEHDAPDVRGGSIAYGHETFVLLQSNRMFRSSDGISWNDGVDVDGQSLEALAFGAL